MAAANEYPRQIAATEEAITAPVTAPWLTVRLEANEPISATAREALCQYRSPIKPEATRTVARGRPSSPIMGTFSWLVDLDASLAPSPRVVKDNSAIPWGLPDVAIGGLGASAVRA